MAVAAGNEFPANRAPEQKEKKGKNKWLFAGIGATAALAAGIYGGIVGATGNGFIQKPGGEVVPPNPEVTNSASANPSETKEPVVTPTPTETVANAIPAGPEHIANYDQLVEGATLTKGEYDTIQDSYAGFAEQFNKYLNFQPSEEELATMENLVSETTDQTGRLAAHEVYRSAFSGMFDGSSELSQTMEEVSKSTFEKWYATRDEEHPYEVEWTIDENNHWTFSDNSLENSLPDEPFSAVYNFPIRPVQSNLSMENQDINKTVWQWPGNATFVKLGEVPATVEQ